MKIASRLVNFDACPGDPFKAVATPIYQTATFEQESAEQFGRYDYSRSGNPTRTALETLLARLENADAAYCFSSGLAAISAVARLLSAGDEILAGDDLYGGTYRLFSTILDRTGIGVRYADACDLQRFAAQITPRTRLIFVESPTNPLLRIVDLRALAELAHEHGALLCVDSSAMSPYLQTPLDLGADVVVHSATKYLSGHGDVTAGVVAVRSPEIGERIYHVQNGEGACLGPFEAYLLLRSIKTLKLRIDAQQANAARVAEYLRGHPAVQKLYYPGRKEHRGHDLHFRQARGAGAVISFQTGSFDLSKRVAEATQIFRIRVSFGSVNSSITLPGCMSHASIPADVRKERALAPDLVRLSVGIEDADDLIADLEQAFAKAMQQEEALAQRVTAEQGS
ncbi:MAG TPA: cystathionine beta-lyase [Candidatus Angelobacter sp.]|nr:cystathionine beta-lyase [Candidatus Angelobacter sp.]